MDKIRYNWTEETDRHTQTHTDRHKQTQTDTEEAHRQTHSYQVVRSVFRLYTIYNERLSHQYRYAPHQSFLLPLSCSSIVHHLSGLDTYALSSSTLKITGGCSIVCLFWCAHRRRRRCSISKRNYHMSWCVWRHLPHHAKSQVNALKILSGHKERKENPRSTSTPCLTSETFEGAK